MLLHVLYHKFGVQTWPCIFHSNGDNLGFRVLMEDRVQPEQESIFGCFVRVIWMSTKGTVGSYSHDSGKASLRLSYHGSCSGWACQRGTLKWTGPLGMGNVVQPMTRKIHCRTTGHTGRSLTDRFSHEESGLHCTRLLWGLILLKLPHPELRQQMFTAYF